MSAPGAPNGAVIEALDERTREDPLGFARLDDGAALGGLWRWFDEPERYLPTQARSGAVRGPPDRARAALHHRAFAANPALRSWRDLVPCGRPREDRRRDRVGAAQASPLRRSRRRVGGWLHAGVDRGGRRARLRRPVRLRSVRDPPAGPAHRPNGGGDGQGRREDDVRAPAGLPARRFGRNARTPGVAIGGWGAAKGDAEGRAPRRSPDPTVADQCGVAGVW